MKTVSIMLLIVAIALTSGCASSGKKSRTQGPPTISGQDLLGTMARGKGPESLIELGRNYADAKYPLKGEEFTKDPLGLTILRAQLIEDVVDSGVEGMNAPLPPGGLYRMQIPLTSLDPPMKWTPSKQKLPKDKDFFVRLEMRGVAQIQPVVGEIPIDYFVKFDLSREYFRNIAVTQSEYERMKQWFEEGNEPSLKFMISPDHDLFLEFRPAHCDGRFHRVTCEMLKPSVHIKNYKPRITAARIRN
jgi:hypothetical protein